MGKKRNKYRPQMQALGGNSALLPQRFPPNKATVPKKLLLHFNKGSPGFFVGGLDQFEEGYFAGIPPEEDGNFIIVGGNGSGKSASIAKPTLRTWSGPIFAIDVKGELSSAYTDFLETSLRQGQLVRPYIVLDPMNPNSWSYDPFWWLMKDDRRNLVGNIWEITYTLIPKQPEDNQPFWVDTERGVLAAALYYFFNLGLSFSETLCMITTMTLTNLCQMLAGSDDAFIKMALGEMASMKPETIANVDRGLRNKLINLVSDIYLSHFFCGEREGAKCLNWDDLRCYNIFLRVPEDKIEPWGVAINLLQTQLIRYLERQPDRHSDAGKDNPPVLLLFDEFARLGKLDPITNALSTLRSKNVHIALFVQSVAQIDKLYGERDRRIIFDNCQFKIILQASDPDTQRYMAELIGTCIHQQSSASEHLNPHFMTTGYSYQQSDVREWAVHPHTLSTLDDVILLSPYGAYQVDKARPYREGDKSNADSAPAESGAPVYLGDYWMSLFRNDTKGNPDTAILEISERVKAAAKRVSNARRGQRKAEMKAVQEQQE